MIGKKNLGKTLLRGLGILAAGAVPALFEWSTGDIRTDELWNDAAKGVLFAAAIGGMCVLILPRIAHAVLRQTKTLMWIYLVSTIVAIAAVGCLAATSALAAVHLIQPSHFWGMYSHAVRVSIVITLVFTLSSFFYQVLAVRLNAATEALKTKELCEGRLRQAATEARLSSLESRVHPHFLFNTLNSIGALIRENPAQAERMVERLSSLLRFSLDSSGARLVPLEQELAIVRHYLEIETVRFGRRLRYAIDCDAALSNIEVPPMSIQTLVENSVKFAVSPRREGAEIQVRAHLKNGVPAIDVIDDGPGFSTADLKGGHGLDLLQSRLAVQFGPESGMEIGNEAGLTRVTVLLPQKVLPQEAAAPVLA